MSIFRSASAMYQQLVTIRKQNAARSWELATLPARDSVVSLQNLDCSIRLDKFDAIFRMTKTLKKSMTHFVPASSSAPQLTRLSPGKRAEAKQRQKGCLKPSLPINVT